MKKLMAKCYAIWALALLALAGCGTKSTGGNASDDAAFNENEDSMEIVSEQNRAGNEAEDPSGKEEKAKVVRLLRSAATMFYDEETGKVGNVYDNLPAGYYNLQGETKEYYLICLGQDAPYTIPKKDAEIVEWTASQGHGYILLCNEKLTTVHLKAEPSDASKTIESFPDPEGIPESAECIGVYGEWYKVNYAGKEGYVKRAETEWNISNADACGAIR